MLKNHPQWASVDIITTEKATTVLWSHTPEEFVAELRRRGEVLCIAKGSCKECYYTPDRSIKKKVFTTEEKIDVPLHRFIECACGAVAARMGLTDSYIQCYGYYYSHFHENPLLQAAQEAHLVEFVDTKDFPGLRDSHLTFIEFR